MRDIPYKALPDWSLFAGSRQDGRARVTFAGHKLFHVVHHSPTGLEWGYEGSGPADLALSILSTVIDEPKTVKIYKGHCGVLAWTLHQDYKRDVIAHLDKDHWFIKLGEVKAWLANHAAEIARLQEEGE